MTLDSSPAHRVFFAGRQSYRSWLGLVWLVGSWLASAGHAVVVWMAISSLLIAESLMERGFVILLGLLFGAMGLLWLWLAIASLLGVIRGGAYESSIRADAINVGTPFGTRRYAWAIVVDLTLHRRMLSQRYDLAAIVKSGLGIGTNTITICTDRGITEDEFDQLYDELVEQGLLPEDEEE